MAFPRKPGIRVESVVFNGFTYRRYPDSPRAAHRRYFSRTGGLLHRDVWELHHGPIPAGWHVHHKDGDPGNNAIDNLECLPPADHAREHEDARRVVGTSVEHLALLDRIRPAAAEWHRSEEGRAWHREHAKESLRKAHAARKPAAERACRCTECSKEFIARSPKAMYCSDECLGRRNNRVRNEANLHKRLGYTCAECGGEFTAATTVQRFCTPQCKTKHNNRKKRAGLQP